MTKALRRAIDARPVPSVPLSIRSPRALSASASRRRALSVVKALEWAFAVERVSVEFDEVNPDAYTVGCDPIWRMMQQAELGCRVDGGGVSMRADDAEVIASIVARLPAAQGGKAMALQVAHHARACSVPDAMVGVKQVLIPALGWKMTKHGEVARKCSGKKNECLCKERHVYEMCPVKKFPSAAQIASARRGYLDWYGALIHLRYELATCGLATIDVTTAMPPMTPWRDDG